MLDNFFKSKKNLHKFDLIHTICIVSFILVLTVYLSISNRFYNASYAIDDTNYLFLSDLPHITANNWSFVGWGSLGKDKNPENKIISLMVDGKPKIFTKGIGMHAKSQLTYNILDYSGEYTRFVTKIGVDASRGTNGSVWFQITASKDGENWTELYKSPVMNGNTNAIDVDVNIEGYKYLRIIADPNGNNSSDHAVLGHPRLVTADFTQADSQEYSKVHPVAYYDDIFSKKSFEASYESNYRLILERDFVNKFNYEVLQDIANVSPKILNTLDWIFTGNERLELISEVGEISDSTVFLSVLADLYHTYKKDLSSAKGFLYQKMMISLAAAYSTDIMLTPLSFNNYTRAYDPLERFRLYKQLYDTDKLLHKDWFENYHVQLMRTIMQDGVKNDELLWLNNYIYQYKNGALGPYSYMGYVQPHYARPEFINPDNKDKYEAKYHLAAFNVPYGGNVSISDRNNQRYWMVFEAGGICWNISRVGSSISKTVGLPSTGLYQPDHEVYLFYDQDANGNGFWSLGNNIFGWGKSSTKWYGGNPYRLIFNWGNKYFTDQVMNSKNYGTSSGYMYLGQANLNNLAAYRESYYLNLLANSYSDNEIKLSIYNKALKVNPLNLDSYDYKINMYKALNKNSREWKTYAEEIISAYKYYPQAMYDLLKVIKPFLEVTDLMDIEMKEHAALEEATHATKNEIWQDLAARELANALLGRDNKADIASFSFDGENAGKIMINSAYDEYDFAWYYSLDGGKTLSEVITAHSYQLTPKEIASITEENDIQIAIQGLGDLTPDYTFDIQKGTISSTLYANDLENRVIGVSLSYEWRNSEEEEWTSYSVSSPNNTGDKTLYVRAGATGRYVPSDQAIFTFTEDNQPDTAKYIPIRHLSVEGYSTQSKDSKRPFYAPNAIDGNINTIWHTDFAQNVLQQPTKPFYTIKLDNARYISALEFVQRKYRDADPAWIKNAIVYVSEDGENWKLAGRLDKCPQNNDVKRVNFDASVYGQYVKLEMETYDMFASAAMINLFEDITKVPPTPAPSANVGYSTTEPTNGEVIARLINGSTDLRILNNGGKESYTFTKNGEFTFEFEDKNCTSNCEVGKVTAKVDWIDKVAPTATIEYSTSNKTNQSVIATLKASEDVIVTNNGTFHTDDDGNILDSDGNIHSEYSLDKDGNVIDSAGNIITNINTFTHEFYDNGEFIFEFEDLAGNKGNAKAVVDWIDHDTPKAVLHYDKTGLTNKDVTVNVEFNEDVIVTNNGGKASYTFTENGEFTFEFEDLAGNKASIMAKVTWIDKVAPKATISYDITTKTTKPVTATIHSNENIYILNNGGRNVYTFRKNGEFEFVYRDILGNYGRIIAKVDWIESSKPETPIDPEEPTNPETPVDPEEPTNPETPVDPEEPTNPETPIDPEEPTNPETPIDPEEPTNPEIPVDPENPTNPEEPTNPEIPVDPEDPFTIKNYKIFTNGRFTIYVDSAHVNDTLSLAVKQSSLNKTLEKNINSKKYDYYEVGFDNQEFVEGMILRYEYPSQNKLLSIYFVTEDNQLIQLEYKNFGKNRVDIEMPQFGKYLFLYEETEEKAEVTKEQRNKYNLFVVIIIILAAMNIGLIIIRRRKYVKE